MMSRCAIQIASALIAGSAAANPVASSCNTLQTTHAIVDCVDQNTKQWDHKLNDAYQALLTMLGNDPADKPRLYALTKAQRAWLAYRDANCRYYETEDGTIRMIDVASCNLSMVQSRAEELQADGSH